MSKIERCIECDEPTGKAGISEDSLYLELDGSGPYCEQCYLKQEQPKELTK